MKRLSGGGWIKANLREGALGEDAAQVSMSMVRFATERLGAWCKVLT